MNSSIDMETVRTELASSGKLRVGVVFAPEVSTFFVSTDEASNPYGPTVDLGKALAESLGVQAEFSLVPNSGELTDAVENETIDVAFMPMDEERKQRVAFGPSYFVIESTGLVHADSAFQVASDLNQAGVRVAGIANTTTIRNAERVLPAATIVSVASVADAMEALRSGKADAVALSRDVLLVYQAKVDGTRIVDGTLHSTGIAIAVSRNRPVALRFASLFLEEAKANGLVRQAFDKAGLVKDLVAPVGT